MIENNTNLIMYTTEDGITRIQATFDNDTVWLSIDQMAELFQRDKSVIGKHVRSIFTEGELDKKSVWAKFAYTASDGKTYQVDYYNLDVIISVGYRVKSLRGTQFRIWAMQILKEYMQKGFALDDKRLKELGGGNYFDELLERIRDIRSSEKVFWRKVLDIYATSIDYNPNAEIYLSDTELDALNKIVTAYLDIAEVRALDHEPMYMKDWLETIDDYLKMTRREILTTAGRVSHQQALDKAHEEYKKYKAKETDRLSIVEKHFLESIGELDKIEGERK